MDFGTMKTIAAFGGLLLGLGNFGIAIYEKFMRKASIALDIEKAEAKMLGKGWYGYQIDANITAKRGNCWIKTVWLSHPRTIPMPWEKESGVPSLARVPLESAIERTVDLGHRIVSASFACKPHQTTEFRPIQVGRKPVGCI